MTNHRRLFWSLGLSAVMGLMTGQAQAGSITLNVDLNGVVVYSQSSVSPDQNLTVLVAAANAALTAHGSAYQFTTLGAQSNYQGSSTGSLQTNFQVNTSGTGTTAAVLSIDTTQSGFLHPTGTMGDAKSSAGGQWNNANGSVMYQSNFQGTTMIPTPPFNFAISGANGSYSNDTGFVSVGAVPSGYELSNHFLINIAQASGSQVGGTGGIVVTAIPEPASVLMLLTAMPLPLALVGLLCLRRRRALA